MSKPTILSGMQPSGNLHVGNYLGALKNWVELQNSGKYDSFFCIVDYHSLAGDMKSEERKEKTIMMAAEFIAAGIDLEKSSLFVQSEVPECTELAWIFNCVTPVSELERMTQFKDKSARQAKNINAGLFTYPVLQAADILLYHGTDVPVGEDQVQHIELTRDIARWFNNRYGDYFPETKPLLTEIPRVKSLSEPATKMSKSHGEQSVIHMADEPAVLEKKLKKAVTASEGGGEAPGVENLLLLLKHFGSKKMHSQFVSAEKDGSIRYGDLKSAVAEEIGKYFVEFRERRSELLSDPDAVREQLMVGTRRAKERAEKTMAEVRELVGIR